MSSLSGPCPVRMVFTGCCHACVTFILDHRVPIDVRRQFPEAIAAGLPVFDVVLTATELTAERRRRTMDFPWGWEG